MSLITSGTAAVAASAGAGVIIAPAALLAGTAALGYALTHAPFWEDIEQTTSGQPNDQRSFFSVGSLHTDLLAKAEHYYEHLLQLPETKIPPRAMETVAGVLAVKDSPLIAATLHHEFGSQLNVVLDRLARIDNLSRSEIQELNDQAAQVIEGALTSSQRRVTSYVAQQLKAAARDVGFTVKEEATSEGGTAFIAVNREGQTLAAHVDDQGTVTTDMAGFSGRSCEASIANLHDALERRGVHIERKHDQPHYLFKGGALLGGAAQAEHILQNANKHSKKRKAARLGVSAGSRAHNSRDRAKNVQLLNRLRQSI